MSILKNLRDYASGKLDESALQASLNPNEGYDFENDEEFVQECAADCLPTFLQMELLGEDAAEAMDEATKEAFIKVQDYLVGQGIMTEAAKVTISNPKINVVHLNPKAMIARLTSIITIKMARKDNVKAYKKYKLGQKIKKENMGEMRKRYGAKAERLARKLYLQNKKNSKTAAIVEEKKPTAKK